MSYGIEQWGKGSWGGFDFIATNHIPSDFSSNIARAPSISFTLVSQSGNVTLASINVSTNSISLITNGVFTIKAIGTIDDSDPASVNININILHEFASFELIVVVVSAINASNQSLTLGNTWQFTVDNTIHSFQNYIVRGFERVFAVNSNSHVTPPQNTNTIQITDGLKLYWDNVQNAISYNIYWSLTPGVTQGTGTLIQVVNSIYYNHIPLLPSTVYYYIIVSIDKLGNSSTESLEFSGTTA